MQGIQRALCSLPNCKYPQVLTLLTIPVCIENSTSWSLHSDMLVCAELLYVPSVVEFSGISLYLCAELLYVTIVE